MNIAVIVEGGLVELLQATPLLRTLAAGLDDPHITLVGPPVTTDLEGSLPGVEAILPLRALDGSRAAPLALVAAWRELRRRRFEVAILCSSTARTRMLAYTTGIQRRVGTAASGRMLSFPQLTIALLSEYVRARPGENNAAAWLRLAGAVDLDLELHTPAFDAGMAARRRAERELLGSGIEDGRLLVCMAPGQAYHEGPPTAAWEPQRYAHLGNQLAMRHGAGVVLVGTTSDREDVDRVLIDLGARHLDLCGQLNLREIAAVLERCDLMIAGDSPLLHVAAAVGTAAVGLFGPTDGRRRGPYGAAHRVVQAVDIRSASERARAIIGQDRSMLIDKIRVDDVLAGIETPL